ALTEMDPIISQQRPNPKNPFAQTNQFGHTNVQDSFPRSFPTVAMNSPLPDSFALWPPTPHNHGNRPSTVHEHYHYPLAEECSTAGTTWDPDYLEIHSANIATTGVDVASQYNSPIEGCEWDRPRGAYGSMFRTIDTDDRLGSSYGSSSNGTSLLDPHYPYTSQPQQTHGLTLDTNFSRRLSDAASLSSADAVIYYEDSFDGSIMTDYTHQTPITISTNTTPLSPVMSVRSASRGRGSPSPSRTSLRAPYAPYSTERNKRWSTGSFIPGSQQNPCNGYVDPNMQLQNSHHSSPTCSTVHPVPDNCLMSHSHAFPSSYMPNTYMEPNDCSAQMPNHVFWRMLHSNADPYHHCADLSDPPDLHASLREEQIPPPPEDMNPADPDMMPHEQDMRFDGDLYTPRWVRGHGNKREGWCGICKPGRWLVLKNSAFWYDKSFTHGISAATGLQFNKPSEVRRMDGNPDVWEGLCHACQEWVPLVSNKKKGTTWFRHAYKCHTHPKIKDAPKRRRESSQGKAAAKAKFDGMNENEYF
ncbi:hypothetical protein RUND412_007784, partial [Rhizina undulata]